MKRQFTPAAERVLSEAGRWSEDNDLTELTAPALLMGLLAESECRAALMLAAQAITAAEVHRQWPGLTVRTAGSGPMRFSREVEASLAAATIRLQDFPRPLFLATEHLLLGLVAGDHPTSAWLRQRGFEPESLERDIYQQHGLRSGPLPISEDTSLPLPLGEGRGEGDRTLDYGPTRLPPAAGVGIESPFQAGPLSNGVGVETERIQVLRVVDAAHNRAREGLRVVEDYVRFVLDDRHLTERLKRLRHDLTALLSTVSMTQRLAARDTEADVGTSLSTPGEHHRENTASVLRANFIRLQEALRSLEEFGKILDPRMAVGIEQVRYQAYTLHRAVEITRTSAARLAQARLYVLIDGQPSMDGFATLVQSMVTAGVHVLQLRDKRLDDRRLLERAKLLRDLTRGTATLFVMNDRPDLACLAQADGVHVGQEELSVKDARQIVGPNALIGVSTHSIQQARRAVLEGANYLGVGPTFPSGTKQFDQIPGLKLVRAVADEIRLPAFAIGGIDADNLSQVLAAGLGRVAVSGAVATAADPAAVVGQLLAKLA